MWRAGVQPQVATQRRNTHSAPPPNPLHKGQVIYGAFFLAATSSNTLPLYYYSPPHTVKNPASSMQPRVATQRSSKRAHPTPRPARSTLYFLSVLHIPPSPPTPLSTCYFSTSSCPADSFVCICTCTPASRQALLYHLLAPPPLRCLCVSSNRVVSQSALTTVPVRVLLNLLLLMLVLLLMHALVPVLVLVITSSASPFNNIFLCVFMYMNQAQIFFRLLSSLSFCFSLFFFLVFSLSLSLALSLAFSLSFSLSISPSLSINISVFLSLSPSLSLNHLRMCLSH